MKISLEWVSQFMPGPLDAQAAADALTHGGLNVESVQTVGPDTVLDVEVTSNRGDCLCHIGLARELAALLNRPFRELSVGAIAAPTGENPVKVRIDSPPRCPNYTARVIRGVRIGPSPEFMTRRLSAVGLRPINNVVDATNYVLMEMGQPLHAFDLAHIGGGQIIVREAAAGEKLTTLDGKQHRLDPPMLVIADANRALALAGIMGGADSQVTGATVDVLLESARFDPLSVRRASRALGLRSDSSFRFERGIDPTLPARASLRATQLILEIAGGQLVGDIVSAGENPQPARRLELRLAKLNRVLGTTLQVEQVVEALKRLHLSPALNGQTIQVTVPSWRLDLNIEVDLVEEVARVIGYDKLPLRQEISIRLQRPSARAAAVESIRQTLVAAGFFEAVTFSFVSDGLKSDFFPPGAGALRADSAVRKADATLRPSLLPGLLEAVRHNHANGTEKASLFETGSAFLVKADGSPDEREKLALVSSGDWRDLRGAIESLLVKLDAQKSIQFVPDQSVGFAPGACGRVEWDSVPIGFAGQIDAAVAQKLSLRNPPMAAELNLRDLIDGARVIARPQELAAFPAVKRDLSLIMDESVPYERIEQTLRQAHPENLEAIEYVTTYRGKPLEAGQKSLTVTLVFRSPSTTLTGAEVETAVAKVLSAAEKIGAKVRQ